MLVEMCRVPDSSRDEQAIGFSQYQLPDTKQLTVVAYQRFRIGRSWAMAGHLLQCTLMAQPNANSTSCLLEAESCGIFLATAAGSIRTRGDALERIE